MYVRLQRAIRIKDTDARSIDCGMDDGMGVREH
jgi:hypothetical protein